MLLLRLIVLVSVYWYHYGRSQHQNTELYQRYCPNTKLCSSTTNHRRELSVPLVQTPCCSPCYCDLQCRVFSDCCPDAPGEGKSVTGHKQVCAFASYLRANLKEHMWINSAQKYLMVDSCPDYYKGPLVRKCTGDFEETPTFEDIAVVSDSHRLSRVYKNKHCALCNGVDEIKRWELSTLKCMNTTDLQLQNLQLLEVEPFLINNCVIDSRPMADAQGQYIRCSSIVDECTEDVNNTDPNVVEECSTSFSPTVLTYNKVFKTQLFQNIYCYVCNRQRTISEKKCRYSFGTLNSRVSSFTTVLDLRSDLLPTDTEFEDSEKCNPGTIYDKISEHCRPFKCGWYTSVYRNRCLPFADVVPGCFVHLSIVLIVDSPTQLSNLNILEADARTIEHDISQIVYLHTCSHEVAYIYCQLDQITHRVVHFQIVLRSITDATCTYEFLFHRYWKTFRKPWRQTVKIGNQSLPSTGSISFYNMYDQGSDLTLLYFGQMKMNMRRCHHQFTMFLCPYFSMNVSEYKMVLEKTQGKCEECPGDNMSITTTLYDGFYPVSRDEIAVCTGTYGELTNQAFSASIYKWQENIFISIILMTSRMVDLEHGNY